MVLLGEPRQGEGRGVKGTGGEGRGGEGRGGEARRGEARGGEARRGEARGGEARRGEARGGEGRGGGGIWIWIWVPTLRLTGCPAGSMMVMATTLQIGRPCHMMQPPGPLPDPPVAPSAFRAGWLCQAAPRTVVGAPRTRGRHPPSRCPPPLPAFLRCSCPHPFLSPRPRPCPHLHPYSHNSTQPGPYSCPNPHLGWSCRRHVRQHPAMLGNWHSVTLCSRPPFTACGMPIVTTCSGHYVPLCSRHFVTPCNTHTITTCSGHPVRLCYRHPATVSSWHPVTLCTRHTRGGLGWVRLGEGLTWSPTHGPRRLPCRTRPGGCTRVSGHKAYRTADRPQTPRWRSRAGDAAVPVCMCPCVFVEGGGGGCGTPACSIVVRRWRTWCGEVCAWCSMPRQGGWRA